MKNFLTVSALVVLTACGGGGGGESPESSVNDTPIANPGGLQNILAGTTVTLDGSASSDANSDALTYSWTIVSKPAGSAASLINPASPKPTFQADVAGTYVASLIVNDGKVSSQAGTVTVTATVANSAPVANAGTAQNTVTGTTVTLDGSSSSDANSDALTYSWTIVSKPASSAASLINPASPKPTFQADVAGTYVASLVVNDGKVSSEAGTVTVTAAVANAAPVANAGTAQNVVTGTTVTLDGSGSSDANGDALSYSWTLTSKPAGSTAVLSSTTSAKPTFKADVAGTYVASLIVNDGKVNSTAVTVSIAAAVANVAPVANAGVTQRTVIGETITLDGSASTDANGDALTYAWSLTGKPVGSTATLSSLTQAKPTFVADIAGVYVVNLIVNDGAISSASANANITVVPRINGALSLSTGNFGSYNFCALSGTIIIGSSPWTFSNCQVFGNAGNSLFARIQNNGNTPITLTNIHVLAGYFGKAWNIYPESQVIKPNSTEDFTLPLWMGLEVTNSVATFSITGEPDLVVNFKGDMFLP